MSLANDHSKKRVRWCIMRKKILLLFHKVNDSGPPKPTQTTELAGRGVENGHNIVEARMHENLGASIALNYLNIKK